ncbi:putative kinase, variant 2 [Arthrobotrys conoides]|uniref:Kinase, variant 2 n=1 Tax=Arthrobotrys conoides TaxID=74498 RepID=A0AAN8NUY2_9PEZI
MYLGKTTFANAVVHKINELSQLRHGVAVSCAIPMDGYHLSRKDLASLSDPDEARRRRGAPFTFDVDGLYLLLKQLREPISSTLYAPSFDHAIKDPVPKTIPILTTQRIVIVEGNYLCFNPPDVPDRGKENNHPSPLWRKIAALFDEKWVIDTPLEITSSRLALRHLAAGIVGSLEEGFKRANGSDRENSNDILRWMGAYDRKISATSSV